MTSNDNPVQRPASTSATVLAGEQPPTSGTRYGAGIVHYHDYEKLRSCLDSLAVQSVAPAALVVLDADGDPQSVEALRADYADVRIKPTGNIGFAAGANHVIEALLALEPELGFCLVLNPDVVLEPAYAETLLAAMAEHSDVALSGGKLLREDGTTIDSAGIDLPRNRRPRDRGQEEIDRGQFNQGGYVFGVSGAALFMRCSALRDLELAGEIFDEDFFLYHEDTDLAWRCQRLGWKAYFEPRARAVHSRGWQSDGRFQIPVAVRRHSFKNHYLQIIKNETKRGLIRGLPVLLFWELVRLAFALFRDRAVLPAYCEALRLVPRALDKRRMIEARILARKRVRRRA